MTPPSSNPQVLPKTRRVYRRTDAHDSRTNAPLLELKQEPIPDPLPRNAVLIKVHTISLNWRDANIIHGQNPWPVLPNGIPCSDAVGKIVGLGDGVGSSDLRVGDIVTPIVDQASFTGREQERTWLAADVDGVLADYLVMDQDVVVKVPQSICKTDTEFEEVSTMPCAGVTAWSALKGVDLGYVVLVQGTGGVGMIALKLARAMGCQVILSSSSDEKLRALRRRYSKPPLWTVNYSTNKDWHEEVLQLNGGVGVDLVLENGGTNSLVKSLKCVRRGGVVSQVGYLGKQDAADLEELIPVLIDRKVNLRGINVGSKDDLEELYTTIAAVKLRFRDIIDARFPFERAEEAIEHVWHGRQVGKVVVKV